MKHVLTSYNAIAAKMNPPAVQLHKEDVFGYSFIGEFDFLKYSYSRANITQKLWADPLNHQVASKYFKFCKLERR